MMHEEGLDQVLTRHKKLSHALQVGVAALGLPLFPTSPMTSNTVGVFTVPDGIDGTAIIKRMYEDFGSVIAGARNMYRGKMIRIGTMGTVSADDILTDLTHLGTVLSAMGVDVDPDDGVAAARDVL